MRLPRKRWHRHRYILAEGMGVPTPFDTWIAESMAEDEAGLFEPRIGHHQPGESVQAVKTRILIVEDDRDTREVIAFYLSSLGYESVLAASAKTAIELARQRKPDLMLTDLQMPEVDGLELIRRCREDKELSDLPILAVTAYGNEKIEQARFAGADACLAKPINFTNLAQTIEAILDQPRGQSLSHVAGRG